MKRRLPAHLIHLAEYAHLIDLDAVSYDLDLPGGGCNEDLTLLAASAAQCVVKGAKVLPLSRTRRERERHAQLPVTPAIRAVATIAVTALAELERLIEEALEG